MYTVLDVGTRIIILLQSHSSPPNLRWLYLSQVVLNHAHNVLIATVSRLYKQTTGISNESHVAELASSPGHTLLPRLVAWDILSAHVPNSSCIIRKINCARMIPRDKSPGATKNTEQ